jgi:hypothetical protein
MLAAGCAEWTRLQYSRIDRLQGHHVQFAGDSTSTEHLITSTVMGIWARNKVTFAEIDYSSIICNFWKKKNEDIFDARVGSSMKVGGVR